LSARLTALQALQEKVQVENKLKPWLSRHGLESLAGLWTRIRIEPGWEAALEAALRERLGALEIGRLDTVRAFAADAPPSRRALIQRAKRIATFPVTVPPAEPPPGPAPPPLPAGTLTPDEEVTVRDTLTGDALVPVLIPVESGRGVAAPPVPGRSPNPACGSHRTGLSMVSVGGVVQAAWTQGLGIWLPR